MFINTDQVRRKASAIRGLESVAEGLKVSEDPSCLSEGFVVDGEAEYFASINRALDAHILLYEETARWLESLCDTYENFDNSVAAQISVGSGSGQSGAGTGSGTGKVSAVYAPDSFSSDVVFPPEPFSSNSDKIV